MNLSTIHPTEFQEGEQYRRLHPIREGRRLWRFQTTADAFLTVADLLPEGRVISFRDKTEKEWIRMTHNCMVLRKGYAWNGCTPKFYLLGIWWGTPDFPSTIRASLWHDVLYQFSCTEHFPLHRSDCDAIFRRLIELNGAPRIARLYHGRVRKWGRWDGDPTERGEHSILLHH